MVELAFKSSLFELQKPEKNSLSLKFEYALFFSHCALGDWALRWLKIM